MFEPIFPACFVELPFSYTNKRAAFYLALEEHIASSFPANNYLFTWQIQPTVVLGRNQNASTEVDLEFCKSNGIDVIRRKSGGGCIYADMGNIMVSIITRQGAVQPLFKEYAHAIGAYLQSLGANIEVSGRNDILISGKGKICGNAFYHLKDRNIIHGTMLYDTNFSLMKGSLTPDKEKLSSKGVKSVNSRISLLKDELDTIHIDVLRNGIRQHLTNSTIRLSEEDLQNVKAIEADYYDPLYIFGRKSDTEINTSCSARIEGCGTIKVRFILNDEQINAVELSGDFFENGNAAEVFNKAFYLCPFNLESMENVVRNHHLEEVIHGLEQTELLYLIKSIFQQF